jgi:hypothetical protein
MAEVAAYLKEMPEHLGLAGWIVPADGWPMVLGRRMDVPGAPTVLAVWPLRCPAAGAARGLELTAMTRQATWRR